METKQTKPIDAFQGDLDCRPIYLGFCKKEGSYWFYCLKDKVPRFLKFISYFHWDRGPQEVLEMKPLTSEVELELQQYLEGNLGYEFRKRRKNSKEASVFKVYRTPIEFDSPGSEEHGRTGSTCNLSSPGDSDTRGSVSGPPIAERSNESIAQDSGRSTRRPRHAKYVEPTSSERVLSSSELAGIKESLPEIPSVTQEPKRRGRPRKIQSVPEVIASSTVSSNLEEVVVKESEPNNAEPKCSSRSKPKPKDGLVMGSMELLKAFETLLPVETEVTIRKKRGRPPKAKT